MHIQSYRNKKLRNKQKHFILVIKNNHLNNRNSNKNKYNKVNNNKNNKKIHNKILKE